MLRLRAIPKCLPSCPRNLLGSTPPRSNTLIRSAPARTLARGRERMGTWPHCDRLALSYGVPTRRNYGKMVGVPPRIHTVVASATLGVNLDGLPLDLQPGVIVGLLSYHLGRRGAGGGIAGEASMLRPLPPRLRPRLDLQFPWRAAVECLSLIGGVGYWASDAPTPPSRCTPVPVHVRPYQTERDSGIGPSRGSCTGLPTSCV